MSTLVEEPERKEASLPFEEWRQKRDEKGSFYSYRTLDSGILTCKDIPPTYKRRQKFILSLQSQKYFFKKIQTFIRLLKSVETLFI